MWTTPDFYREVLVRTPVWVWVVLASLIALGARQMKDRVIKPWTVLIAPIVFMVIGVVGTRRSGLTLAIWAAVACIACLLAMRLYRMPSGARFDTATQRLHMPGSLTPGAWMITTFLVTYFINVWFAVSAATPRSTVSIVATASVMGGLTGAFFGRALKQFLFRAH